MSARPQFTLAHDVDPTGGAGVRAQTLRHLLGQLQDPRVHTMAYNIGDIHVDSFLTNFSISYRTPETLIADEVLPVVKVDKASDLYPIWSRADANKVVNSLIGPRDFPAEVYQSLTSGSFQVSPRSIWSPVPNDLVLAADMPLDLLGTASQDVREALMKSRELRVAALMTTAANYTYTTALTGNLRWDVAVGSSNADPVTDIMTYMDLSAVRPNILGCSRKVWTALRKNPRLLAAIKGSAPAASIVTGIVDGVATKSAIQDLFEVEKFVVSDAKYRSSADGATETYAHIWGTGFFGIYQSPGIGKNTRCWGKTFRHVEMQFSSYFDPRPGMTGVTYVKGAHSDAEEVTAGDMGFYLDTVIS